MERVLLLYNPLSNSGQNQTYITTVLNTYAKYDVICQLQDVTLLDEKYILPYGLKHIIIAGGDGTIHRCINRIYKQLYCPIGILPTGTSNDFALALKMPKDIEDCVERFLQCEVQYIDLAQVNERYFVNIAAIGMFSNASQQVDRKLKRLIGKLAYFITALKIYLRPNKYRIKISSKDLHYEGSIYFCVLFNGKSTGNIVVPLQTHLDDGKFDIMIVRTLSLFKILLNFIKFSTGNFESKDIIYFQSDEILIESASDVPTDLDGEYGEIFPLKFKMLKQVLPIVGMID